MIEKLNIPSMSINTDNLLEDNFGELSFERSLNNI